jgi:hypothetical protein
MWARIHLIPALQAEEDRDQVRRYLADQAREKELLGTQTKIYNSDRQATTTGPKNICLTVTLQIRPTNVCYHPGERAEVDTQELGWRHVAQYVYIGQPRRGDMWGTYNQNSYPFLGRIYIRYQRYQIALAQTLGSIRS